MLEDLHIVDYRYSRFALDTRTGLFTMVRLVCDPVHHVPILRYFRDWRDLTWTGTQAVQNGLSEDTRKQRWMLFGPNMLDIAGKSTLQLLVDEVCVRKEHRAVN